MAEYIIGVDGGGTQCRAVVTASDGMPLGYGLSGPANIVSNPTGALENILAAIDSAFADADLDRKLYATSHAVLGLAGANIVAAQAPIEAALPFARSHIVSDGVIALQGALGDQDGVVAILGTGSVYIVRTQGEVRFVGGWGFPLSDLGSGARLGRSLLQECLLVYDSIHQNSPLTDAVWAMFENDPVKLTAFARTATPADFGKYVPLVFEHARHGDLIADMLLERSVGHIAETLDMMIARYGVSRISLIGGLAEPYSSRLPAHQQASLVKPLASALMGAVQMALHLD